jgi:hypothetical protein
MQTYPDPFHAPTPPPPLPAPNPPQSYPPATPIVAGPVVDPRTLPAGLAMLLSAGLVIVSALSHAWFTAGRAGVGLLGIERCKSVLCEEVMWFDVKHVPVQLPLFAMIALISGLLAVTLLIHTGVVLLQNAPHKVKLGWLAQTLGLMATGMVCFVVALSLGDWSRGLSLGWATFVGLGGLATASIVTATVVRPLARS